MPSARRAPTSITSIPTLRRSLARLLVSAGYEVVLCASAEEFLALDEVRPACLLTDVRMPGMTGLDLLEALKSRGHDLPIILSSGDAAAASVGSATSHVRFLPKPFDADELLTVLEEAIERDRTLISQRS